ncbi:MAG: response regulator transcription factor [Saprospiraceae bacterium]|jgi:DNA-binding LytR/AlgR family response regulator|nr:response regulator transcription factor [Saprospiraceae bacterium]MBK6479059.1 response regulator transcription factor [Saprospiraceae bacterium]MBK8779971.1 response regulator transcription factor [Saprospiraceae bacterium]MBL0110392.1 response regulator transcription factor [Saprospiraceae bacterium]
MHQYDCIIVEDEPLAAEILQDYIKQIPFLTLRHICSDAIIALEVLQKEKIDLIFLDIHLPKLKGLDFIKSLKNPPPIILTTAYHEFALQGYEYNVLDYLLKPIEFSRFVMAVNKLKQPVEAKSGQMPPIEKERKSIFFNVSKKKVKVYLDEILYVESLKEYIRIVTASNSILTKYQLGEIEEILTKNNFLRIHRSFIVSIDKIDAYTATDVEINNKQIPIGRSYKDILQSIIEK